MNGKTEPAAPTLSDLVREGGGADLSVYLTGMDARETAREFCKLSQRDQTRLLSRVVPGQAARILEDLPEVTAVTAIESLSPETAAGIVHALPSDDQADLVQSLRDNNAAAILSELDPEEAGRITELAAYADDTAGGLMTTEVVALPGGDTVGQTVERLRDDSDWLRRLDVQYAYVVEKGGSRLVGVLRMRDLLLAGAETRLDEIMISSPLSVAAGADLPSLATYFDDHAFLGVPVIGLDGRLLGVVSREAVDRAIHDRDQSDYRRSLGVVAEELRSMPILRRCRMRLAWLKVNIVLNVIAASVIAAYQDTLGQVIALTVFLPIISDMSGSSGSQAVAVSMREMSLELLRPAEWAWVWLKEVGVGAINGVVLGALLGVVGAIYVGNAWFGLVVGAALCLNTLLSVMLGGTLPLVLRVLRVDPALASGPILSTATHMAGFFLTLSFATAMIDRLVS